MTERPASEEVVAATRAWLEKAVIGLNLCPFAKAVHVHDRIRYCVSAATSEAQLLEELMTQLRALDDADPAQIETTLLVHPQVLADFADYNEFLARADDAVRELGLEGVMQVASFHPRYQFEGTGPDDIENYTNRSPYPMLHLLRESSVERAVSTYPDTEDIYRRNIATLRALGHEGWRRLGLPDEPPATPGTQAQAARSNTKKAGS
ncbi:MAG TPA: DUF1415 domain-containing protein [Burkholderiales bacterium]